ncbi:putative LOC107385472-like protein [Nothobranchius furzeri]|uniref:LOC107385472-like protein n=2 Tax=Nothobranchius furzeri TaxID=105023 RepID=A0A9D2XUQ1_NOTFU|nr:putative LOC107385472-like protein [Nothobranchius furzeri]
MTWNGIASCCSNRSWVYSQFRFLSHSIWFESTRASLMSIFKILLAKSQQRFNEARGIMEAETKLGNISLQPVSGVWGRLDWSDVDLDLVYQKENKDMSTSKIVRKVLPEPKTVVVDIFPSQKVHVSDCSKWSWNLVAGTKPLILTPAAPTSCNQERNQSSPVSNVKYHFLGDGEKAEQEEEADGEETEVVTDEKVVAEKERCVALPPNQQGTWKNQLNPHRRAEFGDLAHMSETAEETEENPKEKSICRRILTRLDASIHDYYRKKIRKTYIREKEEGNQVYPTNFYIFYQMTRGQRERQKREIWLSRDKQRQSFYNRLEVYWEKTRKAKEALRLKEEARYERWAARHISIPDSPQGGPKRRMGLWEERSLRVIEFLFH